ncbi:MAG: precorrin-8X methylmutase [Leptolyngbyaceae cyanobacterium]
MEWHVTDAQSLRIIDQEIGQHTFAPAEYEIVRRVIYATADYDYKHLIQFSDQALQSGAAALAARTTLIVDGPMAQAGITPRLQETLAYPVYCAMDAITRPQKDQSRAAWGIETLAKRYPEAIFVIGHSQPALDSLVQLIETDVIRPALVIATPAGFLEAEVTKSRLKDSLMPSISIGGRKGSTVVAVAILNGLIDLAWKAYGGKHHAMA